MLAMIKMIQWQKQHLKLLFFSFQQLQLFGNYQYLMQDVAITLMVCLTSKVFSKVNCIVCIYPWNSRNIHTNKRFWEKCNLTTKTSLPMNFLEVQKSFGVEGKLKLQVLRLGIKISWEQIGLKHKIVSILWVLSRFVPCTQKNVQEI